MKAIVLLAVLAVAAARPEAPLHGGYFTPSSHRRTNGFSQGFHGATAAIFRNGGAPAARYGPPTKGHNGLQNGGQEQQNGDIADDFAPPAPVNGVPAPHYGVPAATTGHRNGHGNANGNRHVNGNGHRNGNVHRSGNRHANANGSGAVAAVYGPPGFQNGAPIGATEDPLAVPASYKFAYKVQDEEAGLDFGHEEAREGDEATGEYRVLLPDGRTQIVTYVANNDGYQPEIKYEEAKGGYSRGPNGNGRY